MRTVDVPAATRLPLQEVVARERLRSRRRTWMSIGLGLAAAAILSVGGWLLWGPEPPTPESLYRTEAVTHGRLVQLVQATGRIEARSTVEVGARVSGTVIEVGADFNDRVHRGQVLARFDTEALRAQRAEARASLRAATASVRQLEEERRQAIAELERSRRLSAEGIEPRESLERHTSTVAQLDAGLSTARAQVALRRAAVELADTHLRESVVHAPIDGIVVSRSIDPGQTVASAFQTPVLFVLAEDLTRMRVLASVDETDIARVEVGQSATFTVDAWPRRVFEARVVQTRNAPTIAQNVVYYEVVLDLDNPDLALKPGMTASVKIEAAIRQDVSMVPNAALRFTPPAEAEQEQPGGVGTSGRGPHVRRGRTRNLGR